MAYNLHEGSRKDYRKLRFPRAVRTAEDQNQPLFTRLMFWRAEGTAWRHTMSNMTINLMNGARNKTCAVPMTSHNTRGSALQLELHILRELVML